MRATKQITLIFFLFLWTIARCFPPIPLNERSTEKLTYEAYLLIEESLNQQKDSTLERRIKEKSIFIAPILSEPECGHDRCKKIMPKKDYSHENLLQLLNQKYGSVEESEEEITAGPLYINIPLKAVQEETDLTMLLTPNKNEAFEEEINKEPDEEVNIADLAGILNLKQTGVDTTTEVSTTETTIVNTQESTSETNALFFLDMNREVDDKTETTTTISSTTLNPTSTEEPLGESTTTPKPPINDGELTLYQMDQALPFIDSPVSFVDVKREVEKVKNNERTSEKPHTAFTVRSTLVVPKKEFVPFPLPKVSSPSPFRIPEPSTTPIVFTPIDNVLSFEDNRRSTTTRTIFTEGTEGPQESSMFGMKYKKFFPTIGPSGNDISTSGPSESTSEPQSENRDHYFDKIVFPTRTTTQTPFMVRFPSLTQNVRFPTPTTSSGFSDRFGMQSRTTNSWNDRIDSVKSVPGVNLTYAIPIQVNLTSLFERIKAQRENHRNREKHSEWFHLPSKWWDTSQKQPVLVISKKNGHMDVQEMSPDNFSRQFNGRSFDFKPNIQR